jgi:hypothetical protein
MQGASGLFGSAILEVAIGLSFLYFVLSVVCSSITEFVASLSLWRAKDLEKALVDILGSGELFRSVTSHPLVTALGHNDRRSRQRTTGSTSPTSAPTVPGRPAYLPANTFALALLDSVVNPDRAARAQVSVNTLKDRIAALATDDEQRVGRALLTMLEDSRDPKAVAACIDSLKDTVSKLPTNPGDESKLRLASLALVPISDLDGIRGVIQQRLTFDTNVQDVALRLVDVTENDIKAAAYSLDQLQTNVETWYDNAMDRMSGLYKRHVQVFLLIVGFIVTLCIGADTLHFASTLFSNPTLRGDLVAAATSTAQQSQPPSLTLTQSVNDLAPFQLLFGYDDVRQLASNGSGSGGAAQTTEQANPWLFWIEKIAGLAITAFAIMLGGPFWFDTLQKLVNMRSSGPKPARSDAN